MQTTRSAVLNLPGATISSDGTMISYPDDNLFASGAVLPWPGGMEVLDPLIDLLLSNRQVTAAGVVRSSGHSPEYDQQLADKRMELLLRIFSNRGIPEQQVQLSAEVRDGAPLEIEIQPMRDETSAGEKR